MLSIMGSEKKLLIKTIITGGRVHMSEMGQMIAIFFVQSHHLLYTNKCNAQVFVRVLNFVIDGASSSGAQTSQRLLKAINYDR